MTDDIVKQLRDSALRHGNYCRCQECNRNKAAADEIERLRAERDEARREVCDWHHTDESGCVKSGSEETAIKRGWDCFKNQETT